MTSAISGINFSGIGGIKVNSYNSKNTGASVSYTSQTYDDMIDFNNVDTYEEKKLSNEFKNDFFDNRDFGKVAISGISNSVFYTITTGLLDKANYQKWILPSTKNGLGKSAIVLTLITTTSLIAKLISGEISGKEAMTSAIQGFSKPIIKSGFDFVAKKTVKNTIDTYFKHKLTPAVVERITDVKGWKVGKVRYDSLKSGNAIANIFFKDQMFNSISNMAIGTGIDYVASVGVNIVTGLLDGDELSVDELQLGTTLLKSTWKTVCATAFETMGTFAGPAGRKAMKTVGTIVGAVIGEFMVEVFDKDEKWCGIAAGATLAGAATAGIVATICCAAGVIAVSVPVAGWIVGAAIIVGAAVGTFVTWLIKESTGG